MKRSLYVSVVSLISHIFPPAVIAEEHPPLPREAVELQTEFGVLGVINHRIQYSKNNTYFDYVSEGAQDNLVPFQRYTATLKMDSGDRLRFVYQPLELKTRSNLKRDITVDNVAFAAGTPMDLLYSFPYYRATYLWETVSQGSFLLHLGAGLQIRNARTEFATMDGSTLVSNRGTGPVPVLAMAMRYALTPSLAVELEAEGNYASASIFNGDDDNDTVGALLDSSLKLSKRINPHFQTFVSVRSVTGGSRGTSDDKETPTGDGFSSNWIDLISLSLGLSADINSF